MDNLDNIMKYLDVKRWSEKNRGFIKNELIKLQRNCTTCQKYQRTPPKKGDRLKLVMQVQWDCDIGFRGVGK